MEKKGSNKKTIIAAVVLIVVVVAIAIVYGVFGPKATSGSKAITVTVVDNNGEETVYEHKTDAEFLRQALEEIEDLKIEGEDGDYGLYVKVVNGLQADYDADGAYWSFYVNDAYCNYSVDEQPVNDGDNFAIKYELAQ